MTTKYAKARNQAHQLRAHIRWLKAAAAAAETQRAANVEPTNDQIDYHLDQILKAAGSGLKHYTMAKPKEDMRAALLDAIRAFNRPMP